MICIRTLNQKVHFEENKATNEFWNIFLETNKLELECLKLREEIKILRKRNGDKDWNEYLDLEYRFGDPCEDRSTK